MQMPMISRFVVLGFGKVVGIGRVFRCCGWRVILQGTDSILLVWHFTASGKRILYL